MLIFLISWKKLTNKFPLLDSIWLQTLEKRYIRKCKFKLYARKKYSDLKKRPKNMKAHLFYRFWAIR